VESFENEDSHGISLRVAAPTPERIELRLEAQHEKAILTVLPRLNPSRKLLTLVAEEQKASVLLLCPHIPDALAGDLRNHGINHGDLNGRLFIKTPWFLLQREPRGRRYRNPGSDTALFAPKASRIVRAVLSQRGREWTQEELTERTRISRGLVPRLLTALVADEYLIRERSSSRGGAARYRVQDDDRLLDAWKAEDDWSARVTVQQFSLLTNDAAEIAKNIRDALDAENVAFTQWFAAHLRHPYTTPPVVSAYVKTSRLPELRFARAVPSGGNLWLLVPEDEGIFFETQEQEGFRLVSDVQIYLDLVDMGQRGPDAAQALRAWDGFAR